MNVFLLRHGQAEFMARSDQDRALTSKGRDDVERMCRDRSADLAQLDRVFYSPFRRAVETSEIVKRYTNCSMDVCDKITPSGKVDDVIDFLFNLAPSCEQVLLVTHQPLVGSLLNKLTGFAPGRYPMDTASLAHLVCDPVAGDCCELNWLRHS